MFDRAKVLLMDRMADLAGRSLAKCGLFQCLVWADRAVRHFAASPNSPPLAPSSLGSEPTFAARYMNDCIGGELSNAFERPLRAAPPVPAFGLHPS